jgi:hypothetical protein
MAYRAAYIHGRRQATRLKTRAAVLALTIGVCGAAVLALPHAPVPSRAANSPVAQAAAVAPGAPAAQANARRIYRYSVVPGGVTSREELARVIKADKVAAAHYALFNVDNAELVKVDKARAVYVSYRKGDKVYWTARKVTLAEGETVLSDGANQIRTRCGNRISDVPQLPVETKEAPTEDQLDSSVPQVQPSAQTAPASTSADLGGSAISSSPAGQPSQQLGFVNNPGQTHSDSGWSSSSLLLSSNLGYPTLGGGDLGITSRTVLKGQLSSSTGSAFTVISPDPGPGTQVSSSGTDIAPPSATKQTAEVPEPGSLWLSGAAFAAMMLLRRRGRRRSAPH